MPDLTSVQERRGRLLYTLAPIAHQAEPVVLLVEEELLLRVDVVELAARPHAKGVVGDKKIEAASRVGSVAKHERRGIVQPHLPLICGVAAFLFERPDPASVREAVHAVRQPQPQVRAEGCLLHADIGARRDAEARHVAVEREALCWRRFRLALLRAKVQVVDGAHAGHGDCAV
eukprot:2119635-Pleurochrysis_carterae.AAC.6